jgi:DNA-binding response OmpR family regulator
MKKESKPKRFRKALVIAFDPEIVRIVEANISQRNFDVVTAQSEVEALVKVVTEKPDLVILDATVPDIETTDFGRLLKESAQAANIPLLVIGQATET